jgi:hypothetical protein
MSLRVFFRVKLSKIVIYFRLKRNFFRRDFSGNKVGMERQAAGQSKTVTGGCKDERPE